MNSEITKDPKYFTGIAFISFHTEKEKRLVLAHNSFTFWERIKSFWNNGKLEHINEHDLTWDCNKLFIEESPEPADIDWL